MKMTQVDWIVHLDRVEKSSRSSSHAAENSSIDMNISNSDRAGKIV
jgi:hypothetical protein